LDAFGSSLRSQWGLAAFDPTEAWIIWGEAGRLDA